LALALLGEVLGGLAGALGLVVDLLYPVIEEVLGEPEVALLQGNGPVGKHRKDCWAESVSCSEAWVMFCFWFSSMFSIFLP
jgi:hypothetical protein